MTMKGLPFALLSVLLPGPRMRFMSEKVRRDDMERFPRLCRPGRALRPRP
ncbi:hypothetical protein [Streptomyces lomondensis]|uniref:Uncharacterized protein n=1 Tax=Streptomyces lomondensis TaxID=68229 RepID=A0ABQ2WY43_9ACTN|nr:hypothetical protein [Streptomyces lomondensis]MCF0078728.1 hypothetical protein [Streptomyces lomondensis]GGW82600.1 hypothetical protein GCM10010383_08600 [Streptomyces lomondensis]